MNPNPATYPATYASESLRRPGVRIAWIDYLKVVAVVIIMIIHLHSPISRCIYYKLACMPMLFTLSGYLFSYRNNPSYGRFAWKRTRQVLVPYLWIGALAFIWWLKWTRRFVPETAYEPPHWALEFGLGMGYPSMMDYDVALWALLALFIAEMVYWPLGRVVKSWLLALLAMAGAVTMSILLRERVIPMLPYCLAPASGALAFYSVGHALRELQLRHPRITHAAASPWCLLPLLPVAILAASQFDRYPAFLFMGWLNEPWYLIGAMSCTWILAIICRWLGSLGPEPRWCRFVAVCSLMLCTFHIPLYNLCYGLGRLLFGLTLPQMEQSVALSLAVMAVTLIITIPLCILIRRHARWLVDK